MSINDFSTGSFEITSNASFITAPTSTTFPSTSALEQNRVNETIRIRERLAELNSQDLRHYFQGIRKLYDELLAKKEEYEVEAIVRQENLKEKNQLIQKLKGILQETRRNISEQNMKFSKLHEELMEKIKKESPEMADKLNKLHEMQKRLSYLEFSNNFTNLRDEIRRYLRKANYQQLLEKYRKLVRIPMESVEYLMDGQCRREYSVKSASLAQFLQLELRSGLSTVFSRTHFPFEEPIDYNTYRLPLVQSAQILKCLKLVNFETLAANGADITGEAQSEPLELVLEEFTKRFNFHFYGDKPTNVPSKPEWFFTQLSYWAEHNVEYFEQHIQPFLDEMYSEIRLSAKDFFLQHLMQLAALKVRDLLRNDQFVQDRRQLSHLIDECVLFEKEMQENYNYPEELPVHVVSELCQAEEVLEMWIKLERDTLSVGVDAILADEHAYEPRYEEAADVDPYLVPNFADSFVILMQSMSERYRSIPNMRLQCRFLKLQLVIVDEFRSRIVQIGQSLQHNPFGKPYPQLMNALWYLTLVLDDWSDSPEFVRLQFFLQQQQSNTDSASKHSSSKSSLNSLTRGTFDESASLYRHVWRQRVRNLCDAFAETLRKKLGGYAAEKWYDWEGPPRPGEITPSMEPFLRKMRELLDFIVGNVSPDSVLTLYHLTNHEVWSALDQYRGASQMLYDITNAVIPLLNHCYGKIKGIGAFDIFNEKCVHVLSTLRLLALPPPAAILLKDEVKNIPEQQLDQKLEQFNIVGLTKKRVMEVLEQRCDLVLLEKLIA